MEEAILDGPLATLLDRCVAQATARAYNFRWCQKGDAFWDKVVVHYKIPTFFVGWGGAIEIVDAYTRAMRGITLLNDDDAEGLNQIYNKYHVHTDGGQDWLKFVLENIQPTATLRELERQRHMTPDGPSPEVPNPAILDQPKLNFIWSVCIRALWKADIDILKLVLGAVDTFQINNKYEINIAESSVSSHDILMGMLKCAKNNDVTSLKYLYDNFASKPELNFGPSHMLAAKPASWAFAGSAEEMRKINDLIDGWANKILW